MKKKNHDRSPDKKGFSVALPKQLIDDVASIARRETRSRNMQIQRFLEESVAIYHKDHGSASNVIPPIQSLPTPTKKANGTSPQ